MAGRRGRPSAPISIVNNVLTPNALTEIDMTIRELVLATVDNLRCIQWFAEYGLIKNTHMCDDCHIPMTFQSRTGRDYVDSYCWACKTCKRHRSIRTDSFFQGSHLTLIQLIEIVYWWSMQLSATATKDQCKIAWNTIVDWNNFIRDVCALYIIDHPMQLGGLDRTVEIDQSKFMHRKYQSGRYREGTWILGMIERESDKCVMVPVEDRSAETLLPIIRQYVVPGTRIITDGWQTYNTLKNNNDVVDHTFHFVDPNDPTINTKTIGDSWADCKSEFRSMHGTSNELLNSHLQEYMWRKQFKECVFGNVLYSIRCYYPV